MSRLTGLKVDILAQCSAGVGNEAAGASGAGTCQVIGEPFSAIRESF